MEYTKSMYEGKIYTRTNAALWIITCITGLERLPLSPSVMSSSQLYPVYLANSCFPAYSSAKLLLWLVWEPAQ